MTFHNLWQRKKIVILVVLGIGWDQFRRFMARYVLPTIVLASSPELRRFRMECINLMFMPLSPPFYIEPFGHRPSQRITVHKATLLIINYIHIVMTTKHSLLLFQFDTQSKKR